MKYPKKFKPLNITLGKGKPRKGIYNGFGFYLFSGDYIDPNKYNIHWEYDKVKGIRIITNPYFAEVRLFEVKLLRVVNKGELYHLFCEKKHRKALKNLAFFFTEDGKALVRMSMVKKYCRQNNLPLIFPGKGLPFFEYK